MPSAAEVESLVRDHLGHVRRLAKHYRRRLPRTVQVGDLECAGNFGLLKAARCFDPAHGVQFWTYAVVRVRGAMTDWLRDADDVNPRARERRVAAGGTVPRFVPHDMRPARFDDDGDSRGVMPEPADPRGQREADDVDEREAFGHLIRGLRADHRELVTRYFWDGWKLCDAAASLGIGASRASQILKETLGFIRERESSAIR